MSYGGVFFFFPFFTFAEVPAALRVSVNSRVCMYFFVLFFFLCSNTVKLFFYNVFVPQVPSSHRVTFFLAFSFRARGFVLCVNCYICRCLASDAT